MSGHFQRHFYTARRVKSVALHMNIPHGKPAFFQQRTNNTAENGGQLCAHHPHSECKTMIAQTLLSTAHIIRPDRRGITLKVAFVIHIDT